MAHLSNEALPKQEDHAKEQACRTQNDACDQTQYRDDRRRTCEPPSEQKQSCCQAILSAPGQKLPRPNKLLRGCGSFAPLLDSQFVFNILHHSAVGGGLLVVPTTKFERVVTALQRL